MSSDNRGVCMSRARGNSLLRPKLIAVSVAACFSLAPAAVLANPTGPTAITGVTGFSGLGTANLAVTTHANAIIHWQGFSIAVNEITKFIQPSALSAVLNRVMGSGGVIPQSLIQGVLSSNGHVYLLNPSGVVIGATARIDVAGLVASSLNLSNEDFLAGRLRFTEIPGAGGVANHGVIETTSGGRVFLIAPDVQNTGVVRSPQGEIVLAAGRQVELVSESNPYVTVKVTADAEQAVNVGSLVSDSGRIGMYGALVRNSGVAEASGAVVDAGGNIRFVATRDVTVDAGSRVAANGASGGNVLLQAEGGTNLVAGTVEATGSSGKGGTVQALGVRVGVIGNGVIDASGETGGGTVLVGGDYQGKNAAVQNAQRTYVGADGVIRADARTTGDGGRVIVWADCDTRFYGSISARGGAQGGDGGFVETSGKQTLAFTGSVDTRAPHGRTGTLLLDPDSITIINGGGGADDALLGPVDGQIFFADGPSSTQISELALEGVGASSNIWLQANNSITINDLADNVLNLQQSSQFGTWVQFETGPAGTFTMNTGDTIRTNGGGLTIMSGTITTGGLDTRGASAAPGSGMSGFGGGYISLSAQTGSVFVGGPINTSGGSGGSGPASGMNTRGGDGGWGGNVNISGQTGVTTASITTSGGQGANPGGPATTTTAGTFADASGGWGGGGGDVWIYSPAGPVVVGGPIVASGGPGASAGSATATITGPGGPCCSFTSAYAFGGGGRPGGDVQLEGTSVTAQDITARGGGGGNGGTATLTWTNASNNAVAEAAANGGQGGEGGVLNVISSGHVSLGNIDLSAGNGGNASPSSASVSVDYAPGSSCLSFFWCYAQADAQGGDGGEGGSVFIQSDSAASVAVGNILTLGGSGGAGGTAVASNTGSSPRNALAQAFAGGGWGFYGGPVFITSAGTVTAGSIVTFGGSGGPGGNATAMESGSTGGFVLSQAFADGGSASVACCGSNPSGGPVTILADGSISTGPILTSGGAGGPGGTALATTTGSAPSSGCCGVNASARGGGYYGGGPVFLESLNGSISTGIIITNASSGGSGGSATARAIGTSFPSGVVADARGGGMPSYGGAAYGGIVSIFATNGSVATGPIFTLGGVGGQAGTAIGRNDHPSSSISLDTQGGHGSAGGGIIIRAGGSIVTGALLSGGGPGGNATSGVVEAFGGPSTSLFRNAEAGMAGEGGQISFFSSMGSITSGIVNSAGGKGGSSGLGGGDGAWGGFGGNVLFEVGSESGQIKIGPTALPGVFLNVIVASGGDGGAGGAAASPAGNGGGGGDGGRVDLIAPVLTINGKIITNGGNAGAGGAGGGLEGPGGAGGNVDLLGNSPTQVTFWNAGFNLAGSVLNAGGAGNPPGNAGITFLDGTAQFLFAEVPVSVLNTLFSDLIPPPPKQEEASQGESDEEKERKARMAICRPRT